MVVVDGKHAGRQMRLPATQFVIGRDPRCHLRPTSSDVSRFHCAIACYCGHVHVRDLKSRNGTFVDERRITGAVRLIGGEVIRVGPLRFQVLVDVPTSRAPSAESGLNWLVRSPDDVENAVLDPSAGTMIGSGAPIESPAVRWRIDPVNKTGAVAGDYLREYLHRHRQAKSAARGKPLTADGCEQQER